MKELNLLNVRGGGWLPSPCGGDGGAARQLHCAGDLHTSSSARLVMDLWGFVPADPLGCLFWMDGCAVRDGALGWDAGQGSMWGELRLPAGLPKNRCQQTWAAWGR